MTTYELIRSSMTPLLPALEGEVRSRLVALVDAFRVVEGRHPELLDVGGRKSPYTVRLPAHVTVTDIERASDIQHELNLGLTSSIERHHRTRRSNIKELRVDDMSDSQLPDESYDLAVSVEVIEHVDDDAGFVSNLARVLRPGARALITTPNGDARPEPTGDHRRHYSNNQLSGLLAAHFEIERMDWVVKLSDQRTVGLRSWSPRHPWTTLRSMYGNLANHRESDPRSSAIDGTNAAHLVAVVRKPVQGRTSPLD